MNICGVLIHAHPAKLEAVKAALLNMSGTEIHDEAHGSRLVVTVEDTAESSAFNTLTDIHRLDGIVAASLVYHHFETIDFAEVPHAEAGDTQ
jgi:nitrate reductase NapD